MINLQLCLAAGLVLAVIASLIISFVTISGIQSQISALRDNVRDLRQEMNELRRGLNTKIDLLTAEPTS